MARVLVIFMKWQGGNRGIRDGDECLSCSRRAKKEDIFCLWIAQNYENRPACSCTSPGEVLRKRA